MIDSLLALGARCVRLLAIIGKEFQRDRCAEAAAALSYTTLLSLVPLFTVMFATLALVPALSDWRTAIENFIFDIFVPSSGRAVQTYFAAFVANASGLRTIGVWLLAISVLSTMATVETTFNEIWEVAQHRSFVRRAVLYVAVLALAPFALGIGLVASSFLLSFPLLQSTFELRTIIPFGLRLVPIGATWLAFLWCYKFIPFRPVRWSHALAGGAVAAVLFELAKFLFGVYLVTFPSQQAIYGAFAVVPIFLIWIYVSWLVVLFGAEFTHGLAAFWSATSPEGDL